MKKIVLLALCLYAVNTFADCNLSVRVSNFPPQYFQDEDGEWQGIAVEMAEILLAEAGCKPEYVIVPWARSFVQLRNGELDMMMNLSITEERSRYLNFIGPHRDESIVLVVHEDSNFEIDAMADLKSLPGKIGVERGSYYGEVFDSTLKTDPAFAEKFSPVTLSEQNIRRLLQGRIVGFLGDSYTVAYRMEHDPSYRNVKMHPFLINEDWVYFGFSKASVPAHLLADLQAAYERAKAAGKFAQVLAPYR